MIWLIVELFGLTGVLPAAVLAAAAEETGIIGVVVKGISVLEEGLLSCCF